MKVENINNRPNQFIIYNDDGSEYFQSYKSIIAKKHNGNIYLDSHYWDYSKTTSKYRNIFLGLDSKMIKKLIKDNDIILTNLN